MAKTPTELQRRRGNPSHRPLPEPQVLIPRIDTIPPKPVDFGLAGAKEWDRIWSACSAWVSPMTDFAVVKRYCETIDQAQKIRDVIAKEGVTLKEDDDSISRPHPLLPSLKSLNEQLAKMEGALGLTPSDRARIGLAEVRKVSELENLVAKKEKRNQEPALKGDFIDVDEEP